MKKLYVLLFAGCMMVQEVTAQAPQTATSADMYLALRKLNVLGSVLYVAAHPDDENTRLISYLSKDRLYRTGYLSLTRGDGGQNLIGDEQGIELGLIRTQELLAARRMDGGEQFFTRAFDFGFSKNPEETFTKWDREKILSDVVWVIRKFQPDVIITRFPTTGEGGHGHHTASAILANEAYAAAADPTRFPEQLKYVKPWQTKRVMWNGFNFGGGNTGNRDDQLKIDVGGYNALLGKSYGEIAAESRSNHKSQGFGSAASRGESLEYFKSTKGNQPSEDLMADVDLSWNRVKGGATISKIIDSISRSFDLMYPEKSVPGLVRLSIALNSLDNGYWKEQKLKETAQLIVQCSGLFIDATTPEQYAVQTDSVRINFFLNNRLGADATLQRIQLDGFDSTFNNPLGKNKNFVLSRMVAVPATKPVSQPYWLAYKMEEGYYNVNDQQLIGQPDVDAAFTAQISVKIFGETFNFARAVKYKFTDPVKGELYEPLVILPSFDASMKENLAVLRIGDAEIRETSVIVKANKDVPVVKLTAGGKDFPAADLAMSKGQVRELSLPSHKELLTAKSSVLVNDSLFYKGIAGKAKSLRKVQYDHIPFITYYNDAVSKVLALKIETYGKKIGYIVGAGDKVPEALEEMGYEVTLLGDKELTRSNLGQFDAIITGVRAYNTNEWMNNYYDKLMKYVNDGGNLIVQYNTSSNIGPVRAKMGPYNFNISRTRVTDENAVVNFVNPGHAVLNFPNKITTDDFKGWIQERSIYHATGWDKDKFETVIAMNDPGEPADEGGLIVAKHGKGYFTYTGIVFFRELPAGVPGAYRLLANIIALNKKKAF